MLSSIRQVNAVLTSFSVVNFLSPLIFRLILAYIFWTAGTTKFADGGISPGFVALIDNIGLPAPTLFAYLAGITEVVGAVLLLLGLGVRWICGPLLVTMLVAIFGVHWDNGWLAIASRTDPEIACRLQRISEIVGLYGQPEWLTAKGSIVILNNGIQFAVYYSAMLLSLFFTGGGSYVSVDDYLNEFYG